VAGLREADVDPDPLAQFGRWFDEAAAAGVYEPEAVALATASADGAPSARMVLMKGFDERGFRFFTNYESRKARELEANPRAALLFHWKELARQVRIEGPVARVSPAESAEYFASRALGSRLSAVASPQSRVIASREELERRVEALAASDPAVPAHWGGYLLDPQVYELWQRGEHRLHDRLRYRRADGGGWVLDRLAP
jgi:pyridoxamine 5'-phosphate oxidase